MPIGIAIWDRREKISQFRKSNLILDLLALTIATKKKKEIVGDISTFALGSNPCPVQLARGFKVHPL
jgi:hypothetical protein